MPEAAIRLVIDYDPITKQVEFKSNVQDELTVFGLLELAKSAVLQQQIARKNGGPRVVVPAPRGLS